MTGGATFFTIANVRFLAEALLATTALSVGGGLAGLVLGFPLALLRRARGTVWLTGRVPAFLFIGAFRRIPFLVTLFVVFFTAEALRANLSTFVVALISVCLIAAAYLAEIIRAGLDSVPTTQREAAEVMNFSRLQLFWLVLLPQAWKVILPPAVSFLVLFIKDTSLASQIGVVELTYAGKVLNNRGFPATLVFGTVLVLYFILSYPLARLGKRLEGRLAAPRHR